MGSKFPQLLLVWELFNPASYLNDSRAGYSILGSRPFCFIALNISCHCLLACKVSVEKSDDSLMGFLLQVTFFLSLAAFNTLSLSLLFAILIIMCLGVVLPVSLVLGVLCASLV